MRTIAVSEAMPEWKAKTAANGVGCGPCSRRVVPFLFSWNFIASLLPRRMRWRGIRYELVSPNMTRILKR